MDDSETLRDLTGVARARNGRLAVNWITRALRPRWRMLRLDGQWYDRAALRDFLRSRANRRAAGAALVPHSRRAMTRKELDILYDPNPFALYRDG